MFLYHYPELWYDAATWHVNHPLGGGHVSAAHVFERANAALPGCAMLRYAAADVEEAAAYKCRSEGAQLFSYSVCMHDRAGSLHAGFSFLFFSYSFPLVKMGMR
jgi:hypothetical protein